MFTEQHYKFFAKQLGSHVIPTLCTSHDWNAGGALKWDVNKINDFHKMGNWMVDFFKMDNPNFKLDKFNKKMIEHAENAIWATPWLYLTRDLPGLGIAGKERKPTDWTFYPIVTNQGRSIG